MEEENKENTDPVTFGTPIQVKRRSTALQLRTPLQDVTYQSAVVKTGLLKKVQYSPQIPGHAVKSKIPKKKAKIIRGVEFNIQKDDDTVGSSLIYKQVVRMLEASKQQYEDKLNEHEKYIHRLEEKLSDIKSEHTSASADTKRDVSSEGKRHSAEVTEKARSAYVDVATKQSSKDNVPVKVSSVKALNAKDQKIESNKQHTACQKVVKKPVSYLVPPKVSSAKYLRSPTKTVKTSKLVKVKQNKAPKVSLRDKSTITEVSTANEINASHRLRHELAAAVQRSEQFEQQVEQLRFDKEQLQLTDAIEHLQLREEVQQMHQHEDHLQKHNAELHEEINSLKACVEELEQELSQMRFQYESRLRELTSQMRESQCEQERLDKLCDEKDMLATSLRRDLDAANQWRRELCMAQDQIQEMQATYLESRAFHENELVSLKEECDESKQACEVLRQQTRDLQQELKLLSADKASVTQELHYTQSSAHDMLMQQNCELSDAQMALADTCRLMQAMHDELMTRLQDVAPQQCANLSGDGVDAADVTADESQHQANTVTIEEPAAEVPQLETVPGADMEASLSDDSQRVTSVAGDQPDEPRLAPKSFLSSILQAVSGSDRESSKVALEIADVNDNTDASASHDNTTEKALSNDLDDSAHGDMTQASVHGDMTQASVHGDMTQASVHGDVTEASDNDERAPAVMLIGSATSAFTRISKDCDGPKHDDAEVDMHDVAGSYKEDADDAAAEDSNVQEETLLTPQIRHMHSVLSSVAHLFNALDQRYAVQQAKLTTQMQAVEAECECMRESCDTQRVRHEQSLARYEQQARESERVEHRLRSEIDELNARVTSQLHDLDVSRRTIEEQSDKLLAIAEQSSKLQELGSEVKRLTSRIDEKTSEVAILREQLDAYVSDTAAASGAASVDAHAAKLARENYLLRTEMNQLRFELIRCKEETQDLAAKANHRQRTLQHNLNCAESEIVKLDDTVERFRLILRAHEGEVRGWPELGALWMEVVYDKRTDSPRMAWNTVTSQVPKTPAKQE